MLRVLFSPCQFYRDASMRDKGALHASNGMWCGIAPTNRSAAYVWDGKQFLVVAHGDVRVNEWLAFARPPGGVGGEQAT